MQKNILICCFIKYCRYRDSHFINMLHAEMIKEIHREPCKGIGKPEALENEGREEVFPFKIMI